ncbi:imidazole glycerol phosphate synthase subunit HisH, partial [Campylobacter coli]|nr:imidazole glycerol phosphate synthase subunit HisH [Campylobacter coli]
MKIIIIDTACANLASLKFCLDRLGFNATISRDLKELESADKLFLPGVGTAKEAMKNLEQFNLID